MNQQGYSTDKIKGTIWKKRCGFIEKNDAFDEIYEEDSDVKKYWDIENKKEELLGKIYYWKKWKKWVFEQEHHVIMTYDCLQEVTDFLKEIKNET